MGTIVESLQQSDRLPDGPSSNTAFSTRPRQSLPAKGACWYCDKPLDSVRRFCGKDCADAFEEEAEFDADAINPPD